MIEDFLLESTLSNQIYTIGGTVALELRPFLATPFEEYSVTEGLLLVLLLCAFLAALYHFIRRFV